MSSQHNSRIEPVNEKSRVRRVGGEIPPPGVNPSRANHISVPIGEAATGVLIDTGAVPERPVASDPIAPLTDYLGPQLTHGNPVWMEDPIPGMRGLQKKLIEHALTLKQENRRECLDAISIVEIAVRLRLRWMQMQMTEEERLANPQTVTTP